VVWKTSTMMAGRIFVAHGHVLDNVEQIDPVASILGVPMLAMNTPLAG